MTNYSDIDFLVEGIPNYVGGDSTTEWKAGCSVADFEPYHTITGTNSIFYLGDTNPLPKKMVK